MANAKQLAILKQGVEAWNQWRLANPGFFGTQTIISVRTLPGLLMVLGLVLVCGGFAVLRWLEPQIYGFHPNTPSVTFILVVIGLMLVACSALIYLFTP